MLLSSWAGKDEKEASEKLGRKLVSYWFSSQVEAEVIEAGEVNLI